MTTKDYIKLLEEENENLRTARSQDFLKIDSLNKIIESVKNESVADTLKRMIAKKYDNLQREHGYCSNFNNFLEKYAIIFNTGRGTGNTTNALKIVGEYTRCAYVCTDITMLKHAGNIANSLFREMPLSTWSNGYMHMPTRNLSFINGNPLCTLSEFERDKIDGQKFYCVVFDSVDLSTSKHQDIIGKLIVNKTVCVYVGSCRGF